MREFFKGWRRKAGCILLFVACLPTVLWVRSLLLDEGVVDIGTDGRYSISSAAGEIRIHCLIGKRYSLDFPRFRWYSIRLEADRSSVRWGFRRFGFGSGETTGHFGIDRWQVWTIPYRSLVTPLTVVAALLLCPRRNCPPRVLVASIGDWRS